MVREAWLDACRSGDFAKDALAELAQVSGIAAGLKQPLPHPSISENVPTPPRHTRTSIHVSLTSDPKPTMKTRASLIAALLACAPATVAAELPPVGKLDGVSPRNVIFILIDDLRYDAAGFLGHPFMETPRMDAMARGGVNFKHAFVTTSLCSPSRASILTGLYMHNHGVVDNNAQPPGLTFFPQYLQQHGYDTAFIGKWHMGGGSDDPRPGFDHWISFRGQGHYLPPGPNYTLNRNGERIPQKGYITDELTDYAIEWLDGRDKSPDRPFFLYLSHKAVHADFTPAKRHAGLYADVEIEMPATYPPGATRDAPMWVRNQRNSWHGVDFPYHSNLDVREYYRQYCRAVAGVDDSLGRVMDWLKTNGHLQDTLVMLMGDNGFLFGEHGLIDKRNAYEPSIRVPLIAHCPALLEPGGEVGGMVANIDIAPTIMEAAGLAAPESMDGRSFLRLATGEMEARDWRSELLYEYYWEYNFPQTPTIFALRTDRYKFIQHHGVWDIDAFYDLVEDPDESRNLIFEKSHQNEVRAFRERLHGILESSGANRVPFTAKGGHGSALRHRAGAPVAEFPEQFMRGPAAKE